MKNTILTFIISLILFALFLNKCENVERKTVTISDTTWITHKVIDTTYNIIHIDTTIYAFDSIKVSDPISTDKDSLRTYSGLYSHQYGNTFYTAQVSGYLENIRFDSEFKIPEYRTTINNVGTVTKTIEKDRTKQLGIDFGINAIISPTYNELAPSIGIRYNRVRYSYGYGVVNQSHLIGVGVVVR